MEEKDKTRLVGIEAIGQDQSKASPEKSRHSTSTPITEQITKDNLYPMRPLLKMETYDKLLTAKSYYNYHYDWNKVLIKTDAFSVIRCTHTPTQTAKIAKIYEKKVLDANPSIYEDIKREIVLLDNLKDS